MLEDVSYHHLVNIVFMCTLRRQWQQLKITPLMSGVESLSLNLKARKVEKNYSLL